MWRRHLSELHRNVDVVHIMQQHFQLSDVEIFLMLGPRNLLCLLQMFSVAPCCDAALKLQLKVAGILLSIRCTDNQQLCKILNPKLILPGISPFSFSRPYILNHDFLRKTTNIPRLYIVLKTSTK